jgi:hypothetical protein
MLTKEEAKAKRMPGWNIRCNQCGSYGAEWVHTIATNTARPGFGALALCPDHVKQLRKIVKDFQNEIKEFRKINFEQD